MSTIRRIGRNLWLVIWRDNRDDGSEETCYEHCDDDKAATLLRLGVVREV